MVLIIDNYDSFAYNLYQIAGGCLPDIMVALNDQIGLERIASLRPTHIIISPGPGRPKDAGICVDAALHFAGSCPILGVGLGHLAVCEAFGMAVKRAAAPMHGRKALVHVANGSPVFRGLPPLLEAGMYSSLAADRATLPDGLLVIAETDGGEIMGVKHRDHDTYGLQFSPESILTRGGDRIIANFLGIGGGRGSGGGSGEGGDHND